MDLEVTEVMHFHDDGRWSKYRFYMQIRVQRVGTGMAKLEGLLSSHS